MPRFNAPAVERTLTTNLAGGEAFGESPKLELVTLVLTSFVQDQFYRSAKETIERLGELVDKVGPEFATQLALYARWEFGMRSVSHVMAAYIARQHRGYPGIRRFMSQIARRPDDLTETVAFYLGKWGKPLPNCFKHGLRKGIAHFNQYQLAKYRQADKAVKLVDLVNLFHPRPVDDNREALAGLVKDKLRSEDTWEVKVSAAGKDPVAKAKAWADLFAEKKLGYFAALRNARNIINQAPESVPALCALLTDREAIHKSLVLPFRFVTALEAIAKDGANRPVAQALIQALDISLENIPQFTGRTLVAVDTSGSMTQGDGRLAQMAGLFGAALWRTNDCDLVTFADKAVVPSMIPGDSVLSLAKAIFDCNHGGTNLRAVFEWMQKPYQRVILLSDMQAWVGHNAPTDVWSAYKQRAGCNPTMFSWDVSGYGTLQQPERQVYALAGFSDKVFGLMKLLESDRQALISAIEGYHKPQSGTVSASESTDEPEPEPAA